MSNPLAAAKIDSTKNNHVDTNFKELDKITHQEITLNIFMWILLVIFVLAPMISFATTNADNKTPKLKSFLHPNFVPINPGVLDDPAIDISKNDNTVGHYEVALNLNYREACMFNLNFHQILNQDNYLLNETEYVIEYEPNFYFSNNNEVVSINDGVSFNNITREFKIGINAGPQTVYPVFGTHQYYFNFSIFANGYHTYTNMVYLTLNITKGKFINELTINSPTIEGVVLSEQTYTDASLHQYREVLTINKTSLNADTINFQEKWTLEDSNEYQYTNFVGYDSNIILTLSGELIITHIPAGQYAITVLCEISTDNYYFDPTNIVSLNINFSVNAEFANYQNEASPILYYYGSSELYNSGTNIIKLNRLIAINGALNTDSGFIPSTAYTEEIDQTLSHTAITAGISYNSSTHQITIPYTIYAHTFQLMLKYKYNSGGTVFPLDGSWAYKTITIIIRRGTLTAPNLKINDISTSTINVEYDYTTKDYLFTTTFADSYTNPYNTNQTDTITTAWDRSYFANVNFFTIDNVVTNKISLNQNYTLPVGTHTFNLLMSIDSTNYNLFQHTFIVTIIVGKATFAKYRVNVGGATEINLEDAYATEYELLSIKGKLPAHIANDPSRHNSSNNTPINTIVEYEIITNTHPDYISLVGNDNHTYIKITPGLTNNLTINVSIKATLTNVSYVTYTTDPVNFTIIVEPAVLGGIWYVATYSTKVANDWSNVSHTPLPYNSTNLTALCMNQTSRYTELTFSDGTSDVVLRKGQIIDISFDSSWYALVHAPDNFLANFFYDNQTQFTMTRYFNLPKKLVTIGNNFCYQLFRNYSALELLTRTFVFPRFITTVGDNFFAYAFSWCEKLESLPELFLLPDSIATVGIGFLQGTFNACKKMKKLPNNFNIPPNITIAPNNFLSSTFANMTSLEGLPSGFNLPQNLVSAGNHAFNSTFYNCSKINLLPNFFNFPQNLVSVGTHVFGDIFSGNINEAGAYFEVNVVELTNVTLLVIPAFDPLPPYYYNHSQTPYCTIFNIGQEYAVTRGSTYW